MKWKPIAEAPKDGSQVLVACEGGGYDLAYWHRDHLCGIMDGWAPFVAWCELPPPPQGDE